MASKRKQEAWNAAIRGERIPKAWKSKDESLLCLIRGIRYHLGFATEMQGQPRQRSINRALRARSIMSNIMPDITCPEDMPYCIWHPEVATEETYRKLALRYPELTYQVARACAVAGYCQLYNELSVLPDTHIAEEARDNGCTGIYDLIMSQAERFDVMNDYIRTVNLDNPPKACLNGDTAVRSSLEIKREHSNIAFMHTPYFNITEDMNIDTYATSKLETYTEDAVPLLYSPLPVDLPTADKDLLILSAAFYGDIDRYIRLRRPIMIADECVCIVRGIFHNTMFAKWWSLQDLSKDEKRLDERTKLSMAQEEIDRAVSARFIMNNDLSRVYRDPTPHRSVFGTQTWPVQPRIESW